MDMYNSNKGNEGTAGRSSPEGSLLIIPLWLCTQYRAATRSLFRGRVHLLLLPLNVLGLPLYARWLVEKRRGARIVRNLPTHWVVPRSYGIWTEFPRMQRSARLARPRDLASVPPGLVDLCVCLQSTVRTYAWGGRTDTGARILSAVRRRNVDVKHQRLTSLRN